MPQASPLTYEPLSAERSAIVAGQNGGKVPSDDEVARLAWVETITPGGFDGTTVIVTGAASGIGRAVASRVAREGGRVIAVDISGDRLEGPYYRARRVRSAHGRRGNHLGGRYRRHPGRRRRAGGMPSPAIALDRKYSLTDAVVQR